MHQIIIITLATASLALAACGGTDTGSSTGGSGTTTTTTTESTGGSTGSGGSAGSGGDTSTGGMTSSGGSTTTTSGTGPASGFTETVAASVCGALFRCCDAASFNDYFAPYAGSTLLADFTSQIPPQHPFADEAECAATLTQMLDIVPFGDWVSAAEAGKVTFDQAAFNTCKSTLDAAACGKDVGVALTDGTCFGFAAPPGGPFQRKSFERTQSAGAACSPIRDGVGAAFFGTCDPTAFFCCYENPAFPGDCALPFDKDGLPRAGKCKAASQVGDPCSVLGSVQICVTGASCDNSDHCASEGDAPLQLGDTCVDAGFNLLGVCQGSYCDVLGTSKCEPLKSDGMDCFGGDECESTACVMGKCGAPTFCKGP